MHASNMQHPALLRYRHLEAAFRVRNKNLYRKICVSYQLKGNRGIKEILHAMPFVGSREFSWDECKQIFEARETYGIDIDGWPLTNMYFSGGIGWYLRELMFASYAGYCIARYGCLHTAMKADLPVQYSKAPVGAVLDLGWLAIFMQCRPSTVTKTDVDMMYTVFIRVWKLFVSAGLDYHLKEETPIGQLLNSVLGLLSEYGKQKSST